MAEDLRRIHSFLSHNALLQHGTNSAVEGLQGCIDVSCGVNSGEDSTAARHQIDLHIAVYIPFSRSLPAGQTEREGICHRHLTTESRWEHRLKLGV